MSSKLDSSSFWNVAMWLCLSVGKTGGRREPQSSNTITVCFLRKRALSFFLIHLENNHEIRWPGRI